MDRHKRLGVGIGLWAMFLLLVWAAPADEQRRGGGGLDPVVSSLLLGRAHFDGRIRLAGEEVGVIRKGRIPGRADDFDSLRRQREPKTLVHKGIDLPGQSDIEPSCYRCPEHGLVLAQDVRWDRDDHPHCPHCDTLLTPE